MSDNDDPTAATPSSHTQPLPQGRERPPVPASKSATGWRPGQVAVVAVLALLLGAAGGALVYFFLFDDEPADVSGVTTELTTTTTTASTTSTTSTETTETTETNNVPGAPGEGDGDRGGRTAVGNSIFTATYQSNQDRSTGDFRVDDEWRIRWDVPVGAITIEVLDADGELVETIEAQGRGESTFDDGGTYRVEIDTDGTRYTVVVTDGP